MKRNESMLECLKQVYECSQNDDDIANIIALLLEDHTCDTEDLEYYGSKLKHSTKPRNIIAIAAASQRLGKNDQAKYYAYKAIFMLNGEDDYDIYNSFLAIRNGVLYDEQNEQSNLKAVTGKTVVTLKNEDDIIIICLDDESELSELTKNNKSINAIHYNGYDPEYLQLQNKKIDDIVSISNHEYSVVEITSRDVAAFRYVMTMCANNPDKSHVISISINTVDKTSEEILKDMQDAIAENENNNKAALNQMLEQYNMGSNEMGLPIEYFISGNYEKYLGITRFLLFAKDQAYYAGESEADFSIGEKIVVSLSTLVLMSEMDVLDLIDEYADRVIVPTSLVDLVRTIAKKMTEIQAISPGTFVELSDGRPAFMPFDKSEVDHWNNIYEKCLKFQKIAISSHDRKDFAILDEINTESLFSVFHISKAQWDCLVLAKITQDAIYMSDDLFLRKLATTAKIKNMNTASMIYSMVDKNKAFQVSKKFSETNYIYSPLIYNNFEECEVIWENLLRGQYKGKYYTELLHSIFEQAFGLHK